MAKKDDLLWKGILEEVFDDFLRFMHPNADKVYDLKKGIEFLDKELEQLFPPEEDEFAPKVVDKLAKVYSREGDERWILIHVEVQGRYQKDFPKRMFTYYYRIFDKYNRPISAHVIFTDSSKIVRSDTYEEAYQGTRLIYRFNTYQLALQNEEELLKSDNPFAIAILVGRIAFTGNRVKDSQEHDAVLMKLKLQLLRKLTERKTKRKKISALMDFLRYYVRFENEENNSKFEQEIQEITGRSETMGIRELMLDRATKQGEQKKSRDVVENLLSKLGLSDEQAADVAEVSIEFVQKIRTQLNKKKN